MLKTRGLLGRMVGAVVARSATGAYAGGGDVAEAPFAWTGFYVGGAFGYNFWPSFPPFMDVSGRVCPQTAAYGENKEFSCVRAVMKMFRAAFLGLASGATMLLSTSAVAGGDLAPERPFTWTGFYLGLNAGGAWGDTRHIDVNQTTTGVFEVDGPMVGLTAGYNFQTGKVVFGVEGDFAVTDIEGVSTKSCVAQCITDITHFGTLRARLGVDSGWNGGTLIYATGGWAFANVDASVNGFATASDRISGWTVGGGVETRFAPNVSLKVEYLYVDFDDSIRVPTSAPTNVEVHQLHVVRAGINYRF